MSELKIPSHIAIIMDGNGRWAKNRKLPRYLGHKRGAKRIEPLCMYCDEIGVKYLTIYAFSTENWNRPNDEVEKLMDLFKNYTFNFFKPMMENNMRFRIIGNRENLSSELIKNIDRLENGTKDNTGLVLQVAMNYGAKDELLRAFKNVIDQGLTLTEENINKSLDTFPSPEPELLIRTGGEMRLSNYLLWQLAYTELYFTDTLWPDFTNDDLMKGIIEFNNRNRRFGRI